MFGLQVFRASLRMASVRRFSAAPIARADIVSDLYLAELRAYKPGKEVFYLIF
ncbi:hypothetical protein BC833DRAFT_602448 [Globomyces pollinis-pini]|nr:hypothetical protein BC833DRAFT_602448 [Globomyces pollinis-pini]